MIAHEMDRVLLDWTVALVRSGAMTDAEGRSVSKALRAAIDSRPLAGAGKVEDTINLLGHAARSIVQLVSKLTDCVPEKISAARLSQTASTRSQHQGWTRHRLE